MKSRKLKGKNYYKLESNDKNKIWSIKINENGSLEIIKNEETDQNCIKIRCFSNRLICE